MKILFNLFSIAKSIALMIFGAIIINIIFSFVFLGKWIGSDLTWNTTPLILLVMGVFMIGFPVIYVWLIRGYTIERGIGFIYNSATPLTNQVIDQVVATYVTGKQTIDSNPTASSLLASSKGLIPNKFKFAFDMLLERAPILSTLNQLHEDVDFDSTNVGLMQSQVRNNVKNYVENELMGNSSSTISLYVAMFFNIVLVFGAWYGLDFMNF